MRKNKRAARAARTHEQVRAVLCKTTTRNTTVRELECALLYWLLNFTHLSEDWISNEPGTEVTKKLQKQDFMKLTFRWKFCQKIVHTRYFSDDLVPSALGQKVVPSPFSFLFSSGPFRRLMRITAVNSFPNSVSRFPVPTFSNICPSNDRKSRKARDKII